MILDTSLMLTESIVDATLVPISAPGSCYKKRKKEKHRVGING